MNLCHDASAMDFDRYLFLTILLIDNFSTAILLWKFARTSKWQLAVRGKLLNLNRILAFDSNPNFFRYFRLVCIYYVNLTLPTFRKLVALAYRAFIFLYKYPAFLANFLHFFLALSDLFFSSASNHCTFPREGCLIVSPIFGFVGSL